MANHPPVDVFHEFLRLLALTVEEEDVLPVLRGSILLQHWFGEKARPAADIDLECFEIKTEADPDGYEYNYYENMVDYGKAMCRYAAISSTYYRWSRTGEGAPAVEFQAIENPDGGDSLWVYGTPGERYFAGWIHHDGDGAQGEMQIDIADAAYFRDQIGIADVELTAPRGEAFKCPAYTQETMLAAKLSWLYRGLSPQRDGDQPLPPKWEGEPKDLFDAHLMLRHGTFNQPEFERVMAATGTADMLNWNCVETLDSVRTTPLADEAFGNWDAFYTEHHALIPCGPSQMLCEVAEMLKPLLGTLDPGEELPFIRAIDQDRGEMAPYLMYADWLEEHGDSRAAFLRSYAKYLTSGEESTSDLEPLFWQQPPGWLRRLTGTHRRYNELIGSFQ